MARDYELKNRNPKEDFRKILFSRQLELMNELSLEYSLRLEKSIQDILKVSPYQKPPDFIKE